MGLFPCFGARREQPATVLTDEVIPINGLLRYMNGSIELAFKFDDVLEPDKLRQSLERLMQIGNWKQVGGRLRRRDDPDGPKFELHIPAQYDAARPGFIFRSSEYDGSIVDHPVASKLPKGNDKLTFLCSPQVLAPLIRRAEDPRRIDDLVYSDFPPLFFDQINFSDATLMIVTFPHYLMDGMGYSTFLKAWMAVLHGREDEVPECHSFVDDCVGPLAKRTPAEKYIFYKYALNGLNRLAYIVRIVWEKIWYPKVEYPTVLIPGWFLTRLREEVLTELATQPIGDKENTHFVSESDVLLAWLTRTFMTVANPSEHRPLVLMNVFDIRSTALPPGIAYITNAVTFAYTILPISQVIAQPLSFLAAQIRRSLVKQRNMEQIEAQLALSKRTQEKTGYPPMIGTRDMFWNVWSNWSKAHFFQLDFSPAVRKLPASHQRTNRLAIPSCFLNTSPMNMYWHGGGLIFGKDSAGNWWIQWSLRKSARVKIEQMFNVINEQHDRECSSRVEVLKP